MPTAALTTHSVEHDSGLVASRLRFSLTSGRACFSFWFLCLLASGQCPVLVGQGRGRAARARRRGGPARAHAAQRLRRARDRVGHLRCRPHHRLLRGRAAGLQLGLGRFREAGPWQLQRRLHAPAGQGASGAQDQADCMRGQPLSCRHHGRRSAEVRGLPTVITAEHVLYNLLGVYTKPIHHEKIFDERRYQVSHHWILLL